MVKLALTAIAEQGYAVVPREATVAVLAAVLPKCDEAPADDDRKISAQAVFLLTKGRSDHQGLTVAADLAVDYRNLVAAADIAKPPSAP